MRKTTSATAIINKMIGTNTQLREKIEEQKINIRVAMMIYEARAEAGLTQAQLAKLLDTKQPVIARLEDADYEGHSLSMLQRIGNVLGKQIDLGWAETKGKVSVAKSKPAAHLASANGRVRRPSAPKRSAMKQTPEKVKSH